MAEKATVLSTSSISSTGTGRDPTVPSSLNPTTSTLSYVLARFSVVTQREAVGEEPSRVVLKTSGSVLFGSWNLREGIDTEM